MKQKAAPRFRRFIRTETPMSIIDVMGHAGLFLPWFNNPSWANWRAVLKAAYALPMDAEEIAFFKSIAGDRDPPRRRVKELWIIAGRRAGKDSIASLIAAYSAVFFEVGIDRLRPGERALVQCLAVDRDQAKIVLNYVRSFFDLIPPLSQMVTRRVGDGLELQNDVDVVVATNSFRAVRGRAILVSIFDECAYWQDERSARPDAETYNAVKPGLATLPGAMLIGISSPYRKSGLLYDKYRKHYGVDDPECLIIKAPTAVLNPMIDPAIIAKAYEDDPAVARAEWGAEFRDDVSGFVDAEIVEGCVVPGVREREPVRGVVYHGFCDPSGGSSDSMTLAVAHNEGGRVVLDCVRERRPPFSPEDVCVEFAATLRSYNIGGSIQSDRFAGAWVVEAMGRHGVRVEQSAKPKSDLYVDLLPLLNSKRIELLDHPRLVAQLCGLERRVGRSGKDSIDHGPGAHDDLANAVAGAAALALGNQGVHVDAALLARVQALPPRRFHAGRRVGRIMFSQPPAEEQGYPSSLLPPRGDQVS